ncbi:MAG: gluconate 2-dehydrogenase subunit 3 family protein, partial [Rhodoplanes sp.]
SSRRTFAARREPRSDAHVERTIAAVIDCMLPGGELPGALALGIDRHIAAATDSELKRSFIEGVAWLDQRARAKGIMTFLKLDEAGRETVLQAALRSDAEGAFAIVRTLRNLAFTLYYTDPAIMAAFAYSGPPQPDGFPDFQEAPR